MHRLGNLTLLTEGLNSAVSNSAWSTKRAKVTNHGVFLMNRPFGDPASEVWDESAINSRTHAMVDALLATWPVPDGHTGQVLHAAPTDQAWVEVKHLVAAGLLTPGTRLLPRPGRWDALEAVVMPDGTVGLDGKISDTLRRRQPRQERRNKRLVVLAARGRSKAS